MDNTARIKQLEEDAEQAILDPQCWELYATLIDRASDARNDDDLTRLIALGPHVEAASTSWSTCWVLYCIANAWSTLYSIRRYPYHSLSWQQPELAKQLFYLRSALQHESAADLPLPRRAQIRINLANAFNSAGRIIEAFEEWGAALQDHPGIAMGFGSRGKGLLYYARHLYDQSHALWFLGEARRNLTAAVMIGARRDEATYPEAISHFAGELQQLQAFLKDCGYPEELDHATVQDFSMGDTEEERSYRRWCLEHRLFLNPMNDAFATPIAAHDPMGLPDHIASGVGITYLAFFNQMKQEYTYARWCLYAGSTADEVHYADREVMLTMNSDSARYSIGLEQVKTSFRAAYSVLDKVAYFINHRWELGVPENRVDFATIWTQAKAPHRGEIWQQLEASQNLWLQALYRLSLDIHGKEDQTVAAPDAREIRVLRNHLEHKFVKIVDAKSDLHTPDMLKDHLAYELEAQELHLKALRMVKIARSALVYLSLALHRSERLRELDGHVLSFEVATFLDEHKF
ncbi:LA2681 family HEPN domain-containing protein [Xanthomonas campestris pv. raphani]|uniref:LA2681 family HEPN domain-containing protein n=1 Tax=Xanthomonas campestris TaxID=339 RepID=UPI002368C0C8|nr:LA2681 family HEPN domain-containing protein [Xanthomonas campestris]MEA9754674.1 LA2681 family HEPN domain-containing protein [Xanthomonas campestris pv. raphani]MEA9763214.1 LA2681 family HEPN domain-containing protein [Xanthomonas campestris pv. raphani]MEA9814528.1 LA2681 family HEPN domain-containing protein [Xanthomonas campestris pv. raphani]MEA9822293.1 LA2681 family HEPN domain-containing protein [Xanthomonas campestris pv. raphani]MEA9850975.1 LA2681 family HEPN domain-containing 